METEEIVDNNFVSFHLHGIIVKVFKIHTPMEYMARLSVECLYVSDAKAQL